ncbi:MAG TPA: oligosaccharide flippase family protein [Anaerolineae bacterium]|nr:oligosaccharide flippase family protein [Anaerolineae bacterium]HNT04791.1 oligosaccharide flippase family protein [Anaerolineae bacterium]
MTRKSLYNLGLLLGLLLLLVAFFWPVTLGRKTLLPLDNLFAFEPWKSYAGRFQVQVPHNELLSDLILQNYAWKRLIVQALQSHQVPLWNPYILSGLPFLAAGQHSALYPLSAIFYVLPLVKAYGWFTVAQLLLAGAFMYIFCRTIGMRRIGGIVATIAFTFSGFMTVSIVHPMIIAAASWLPLLLAVIERLIRTQEPLLRDERPAPVSYLPWIALGALALGLQFLAGHVEIAYYVLLVSGFYALCRLAVLWHQTRNTAQVGKLALGLIILVLLGIGLAAIQVVPLFEVVTQNFRQESATYQQVVGWAYRWRRLIAFLVPDFFGNPTHHSYLDVLSRETITTLRNVRGETIQTIYWDVKNYVEGASYVGVLPLLLALVAVLKKRSKYVGIFASLAVLSLLFVFGTPLYALLYYLLPGVKQLHSPFRWIFPYTLSVSVLAGWGASWLASEGGRSRTRLPSLLGGLAASGGLLGLGVLGLSLLKPGPFIALGQRAVQSLALASEAFADGRAFYSYQFRNLAIFFVALVGAGLALCLSTRRWRIWRVPLWQALGLLVLVAELFVIGSGFYPRADPAILDLEPELIHFLRQDQSLWRLTTYQADKALNANGAMLYGLSDVRGYDSIISRQYVEFMQLLEPQSELLYNRIAPLSQRSSLDSPLLDLLNVKYVLTPQTIDDPQWTLVYEGELRVYRNESVLPRAFVVCSATGVADPLARHQALRTFDPCRTVILEQDVAANSLDAGRACHPANVLHYGLNEVTVEAELDVPGYLVLTDNWFAGWKAYDTLPGQEEQEVPLLRADGTFRAVALAPGKHSVRFKYTPNSVKLGIFVSFVSAVVLLLMLGYWLWRRLYRPATDQGDVKRVAKNALTPMALSLLNRVIDMAFAMLYLRLLEPEKAGRFQFATNFIGYFETALLFGLGTLLTREISKNRSQANRYVSNSTVLRLLLWLALLPVLAAVVLVYLRFSGLTRDTVLAIAFFFLALIPSLVSDAFTSVFYANEKMEYPAAITSVTTLLRVSLGTLALLAGYGFVGMAASTLLVNVITALILGSLAARLFFHPQLEFDPPFARSMAHESLPLMLNSLLSRVFFQVDVLLLKPLRGDVEVGYYGAAYRYIRALDIIPSYFTMAIFPLISRMAESSHESLKRAYILSVKLLILVALPVAVGTTFLARDLILVLAGAEYLPQSMIALQLLIWYMPIGFINSVTHYVLIAINQQRFLTRAFVFGAAFNIISNLLLIPRFGYAAAAGVTVLSELALFIPFYYCTRKNLTTLPWLDVFGRPVLAALLMAGTLFVLRSLPALVVAPLAGLVYVAALIGLGTFRQPDVGLVLQLVPDRIKQRIPLLNHRP